MAARAFINNSDRRLHDPVHHPLPDGAVSAALSLGVTLEVRGADPGHALLNVVLGHRRPVDLLQPSGRTTECSLPGARTKSTSSPPPFRRRGCDMWQVFACIGIFYGIVIGLLYYTKQRGHVDFDEYAVGGRRYGPAFIGMSYVQSWFPGAMFIAFVSLGVSLGTLMFYCLSYSLLGLTFMYLMANRAWRWGHRYDLRSQPHLLELRFNSSGVKIVASIIGIVALLPWAILGLQAMALLFEVSTAGAWTLTTCLLVGIAVIVVRQYWTVRMGMRGLIMTDMLQGIVAYLVAAVVCVVVLADGRARRRRTPTSRTCLNT